ncbi:MAG: membrane protein insertase YidC [Alphaproteobacteria bacterium]|nr:membrane protein insertase YidC [Alphaproteobacteria bacterium]
MDRNFILAIVLSLGVLLGWDMMIAGPQRDKIREVREAEIAALPPEAQDLAGLPGVAEAEAQSITIEEAITHTSGRVQIRTPNLTGSINLQGGRIDDLSLTQFHEEVDPNSPIIRLLSPRETEHGQYAQHGWIAGGKSGENAEWSAPAGAILTPSTPVTLTRREGDLVFEKTISVDDVFMFTIEQSIENVGSEALTATPYAMVFQRDTPPDVKNFFILQEGPLGVIGTTLYQRKYKTLAKNKNKKIDEEGVGGWIGITSKNWLASVIPPQDENMKAVFENIGTQELPIFRAFYSLPARSLAPGETASLTSHVFGGAKDVDILQSYEHPVEEGGLGIYDFDKAVDWGSLFFLTRPIFYTLNFFGDKIGNFGIAILILTLFIKALLFPLANKGYESMAKMKKLQPEIKKLQERYGDDKTKQQQEMMALYKKEKMNPLAGCLPILIQMPIFFALYKTLFVTMELRHQPFLYIQDLAARDPTTVFNLFGLLPYDPMMLPVIGSFLGIGVLPLMMGAAMWFQTKLNPPPADPVQAQIFGMLPFVFVFIFAPFAAGLVLYWFWNTALSILQQWVILKKNGVSVDWNDRFKFLAKKKSPAPGE